MRSAALLTALVAACFAIVLGVWVGVAFSRGEESLRRTQLDAIGVQFREELADARTLVTSQAEMLAHMPGVRSALAARDRDGLLARLKDGFAVQRDQFGMDILHVATRDNMSLLRVHDVGKFGDDLSVSRRMVVRANATGQAQSGLDTGPNGLRVRGVVSVSQSTNADGTASAERIGTVEVGLRLDRLLDSLRRSTGAEFAILLDPAVLRGVQRAPGEPLPQRYGALVGEAGTDWPLFAALARTVPFAAVKAPITNWVQVNGHEVGLVQQALLDYSGRPIGTLVMARTFDVERRAVSRVLVQIATICGIGALGLACFVLVLFGGLAYRPLAAAAARAEALADGADSPAPAKPTGRGPAARLFAALETLRTKRDATP